MRSDETKTERMKLSACSALESIRRRVNGYGAECFAFVLLVGIMLKKSQMILNADTKGELEAILEPSVPRWNYGGFLTGPYHVPEEEAIFWSKASLEAPLNDEGARRYRDVAAVAFPEKMAEIWGTDDTGEGGIAV